MNLRSPLSHSRNTVVVARGRDDCKGPQFVFSSSAAACAMMFDRWGVSYVAR